MQTRILLLIKRFLFKNVSWHSVCYKLLHPHFKSQSPIHGKPSSLAKIAAQFGSSPS
jgi:hypothetical protein